jgi:hypothetical protein
MARSTAPANQKGGKHDLLAVRQRRCRRIGGVPKVRGAAGQTSGADVRLGAPGGPAPAGGLTGSAATVTPAFNFDLKRLTRNDQIVGAATIVFFSAGIVSIGWGFGAFVGLVAAAAAVAPLGLPFLRSRAGR